METYKITTATRYFEDMSWDRVCDVLAHSENGNAWEAHRSLEDTAEYRFEDVNGDILILEYM